MNRVFQATPTPPRSEEHTSELQSHLNLVCRLLLEKITQPQGTAESERRGNRGVYVQVRGAALSHCAPETPCVALSRCTTILCPAFFFFLKEAAPPRTLPSPPPRPSPI